jgi:hypothetical protein
VRGKIAILGILIVTGALAGFGWWWRYEQSNQATEFWGDAAPRLHSPDKAVAFALHASSENSENDDLPGGNPIIFGGRTWQTGAWIDITAKGFLHARHSLTQDVSFDWSRSPDALSPQWKMGVQFTRGGQTTTLLFDFEQRLLGIMEANKVVALAPHTSTGWQSYLQRSMIVPAAKQP